MYKATRAVSSLKVAEKELGGKVNCEWRPLIHSVPPRFVFFQCFTAVAKSANKAIKLGPGCELVSYIYNTYIKWQQYVMSEKPLRKRRANEILAYTWSGATLACRKLHQTQIYGNIPKSGYLPVRTAVTSFGAHQLQANWIMCNYSLLKDFLCAINGFAAENATKEMQVLHFILLLLTDYKI